jgi:hypothetical protein
MAKRYFTAEFGYRRGALLAIFSEHLFIRCACKVETAEKAIALLVTRGYKPLIADAKSAYYQVFSALIQQKRFQRGNEEFEQSMIPPLVGELFTPESCEGIFYIALFGDGWNAARLQIGCLAQIKDARVTTEFRRFAYIVRKSYPSRGNRKWRSYGLVSRRFSDILRDDKIRFLTADQVATHERACQVLSNPETRLWAIRIKASGGALESDLIKKSPGDLSVLQKVLSDLSSASLLTREYVVICTKTSNRVNRFDTRDQLDSASQIGVRCSCGTFISQERIEEFIGPSALLIKLLTGSFWMTSHLVATLRKEGVSGHRIALNIQDGAEEVDAFADFDASLIMFELKDNEFSMGHAYSFGAHLAINKPEYAIIVATKGVAADVKHHFERVQPEAEIVYIEAIDDLQPAIASVLTRIRSKSASRLLACFEPLTKIQMPLAHTFGSHLGIEACHTSQGRLAARKLRSKV